MGRFMQTGVAIAATLLLAGCFVLTEQRVIDADAAGDVDWLEGVFLDLEDSTYTVAREERGVYRLTGERVTPPREMRDGSAMLMGDCTASVPKEIPADACQWSVERLCSFEETKLGDFDECVQVIGAMRDASKIADLAPRMAGAVRAMRWMGLGEPYRDDIVFRVLPLGEGWAAAQAIAIDGYGPYSDFGIFEPQVMVNDLALLEQVAEGGFNVWATEFCVEDYDYETPIAAAGALPALRACAERLATGERRPENRRMWFRPE